MITYPINNQFNALLKEQQLDDFAKFYEPDFFDEIPLYSRYSQIEFLNGSAELFVELAIQYLKKVAENIKISAYNKFVGISIIQDANEQFIPHIFVCNTNKIQEFNELQSKMSPPSTDLGRKVACILKALDLQSEFCVLEDHETVNDDVRVFICFEKSLLNYMRLSEIPEEMLYRNSAIQQMIFFRDRITYLFCSIAFPRETADKTFEERMHWCKVNGFHKSKSIVLPVYSLEMPGLKIFARENFHNWNVTILSEKELEIPDYFKIDDSHGYLFFEGMTEEQRRGPYSQNKREFSFAVWDDYRLYAIMWHIASQFA